MTTTQDNIDRPKGGDSLPLLVGRIFADQWRREVWPVIKLAGFCAFVGIFFGWGLWNGIQLAAKF